MFGPVVARLVYTPLNLLLFLLVHEGTHALLAASCGELTGVRVVWAGAVPAGVEILTKTTSLHDIEGYKAVLISGMSTVTGLTCGYALFGLRGRVASLESRLVRAMYFQLTIFMLMLDPFNLSIGPFIYGGDANGVAAGLGISIYAIQSVFFVVLLANRELIARRLFPAFDVATRHPLFVPWLGGKRETGGAAEV